MAQLNFANMDRRLPAAAIHKVLQHLPGPARFRLATLLRIERYQALALYSINSASMGEASRRGLVDLLDFRLRTATLPIGSVQPLDSLYWVLYAVDVDVQPSKPDVSHASSSRPSSPVRIEWWEAYDLDHSHDFYKAAKNGHAAVLDWWVNCWPRRGDFSYVDDDAQFVHIVLPEAIGFGHVSILQWCRRRDPECFSDISRFSLQAAAGANHSEVLEWLERETDLPVGRLLMVDYRDDDLQLAHLHKRKTAALAFRRSKDADSQVEFFYDDAAEPAIRYGQISVLNWLKDAGVDLAYCFEEATKMGHHSVLVWWHENYPNDLSCPSSNSLQDAASFGCVDVLQFWWDLRGDAIDWNLEILRDVYQRKLASAAVFQWWSKRFPALTSDDAAIFAKEASNQSQIELLDWFKTSGYVQPLVCPLTIACTSKEVYDWWRPNRLALKYDGGEDVRAFITQNAYNREIMEWLTEMQDRVDIDCCGVPADLEWPQLDLISVATTPLVGRPEEKVLDSLEWWRARGAERGAIPDDFGKKRSLAGNVPALEWLLARGYKVPFEVELVAEHEANKLIVKRWWAEVKYRVREKMVAE
ncbi:hypothetical protein DFJ73DRAFT_960101 [Zopfochytrium polystomum]|nr:hypothetical protein DFJ73DRAFT_960101 [Zopfochytrium polystomum]